MISGWMEIFVEHEDGSSSFLRNTGNLSTLLHGVTSQKMAMHSINQIYSCEILQNATCTTVTFMRILRVFFNLSLSA